MRKSETISDGLKISAIERKKAFIQFFSKLPLHPNKISVPEKSRAEQGV